MPQQTEVGKRGAKQGERDTTSPPRDTFANNGVQREDVMQSRTSIRTFFQCGYRNRRRSLSGSLIILFALLPLAASCAESAAPQDNSYDGLTKLFADWRAFENPPLLDGAPDYTAERFTQAYAELAEYRARLDAFDIGAWPIEQQVDWHLINAEMNGFDFNHRVLKPWVRDPAFYQSIWTYQSGCARARGADAPRRAGTLDLPVSAIAR